MASTEQRTGFRFGWGSSKGDGDKSAEQPRQTEEPQGAPDPSPNDPQAAGASNAAAGQAWPTSDIRGQAHAEPAPESRASGFLSELMRAMQAAAEQTRKQIMDRFADEARMHVDGIRSRSGEDLNELRRGADADVAGIREWSKAEIARIKAETDERIAVRRTVLERQVEGHGALVDREVERFQAQVSAFEHQMDAFFARLQDVADPSTFAAVAQGMPEPPQIESLGQNARAEALAEAPLSAPSSLPSSAQAAPGSWEASEWSAASQAPSEAGASSADAPTVWSGGPTPATISDWSGGSTSPVPASPEGWSEGAASSSPSSAGWTSSTTPSTGNEWGGSTAPATAHDWRAPSAASDSGWSGAPTPATTSPWGNEPSTGGSATSDWSSDSPAPDSQRTPADAWTSSLAGQPASTDPAAAASASTFQSERPARDADPIIYGAPAPLAAEALSGSTPASANGPQGSPAAAPVQPSDDDDFSFSADARLAALGIVRREPAPASPEAQAPVVSIPPTPAHEAASEQPVAGGVTSQASESGVPSIPGRDFNTTESAPSESSAARLAGLVPSSELPANGRTSGAPVPTHVIVTGLLSVASIASFKRQLSRIPGVQGVGVSSGPDGEFIFKTTHEPGVSLAAVIPTLPGFGAEVVKSGEGTIQVAAHDPEADA